MQYYWCFLLAAICWALSSFPCHMSTAHSLPPYVPSQDWRNIFFRYASPPCTRPLLSVQNFCRSQIVSICCANLPGPHTFMAHTLTPCRRSYFTGFFDVFLWFTLSSFHSFHEISLRSLFYSTAYACLNLLFADNRFCFLLPFLRCQFIYISFPLQSIQHSFLSPFLSAMCL